MTATQAETTLPLAFTLNGAPVSVTVPTNRTLADLLRDDMRLKGTRIACGRTVCGACTVLIDGVPRAACSAFAWEVDGATVTTIEGVEGRDGAPDAVQRAFARFSAFQCGYCTSGMVLMTRALLAEHPRPDRDTIRDWISSNICRCTGYGLILEAVEAAAADLAEGRA
jgi:carbon-monoxide dehydrogenase small subunit